MKIPTSSRRAAVSYTHLDVDKRQVYIPESLVFFDAYRRPWPGPMPVPYVQALYLFTYLYAPHTLDAFGSVPYQRQTAVPALPGTAYTFRSFGNGTASKKKPKGPQDTVPADLPLSVSRNLREAVLWSSGQCRETLSKVCSLLSLLWFVPV